MSEPHSIFDHENWDSVGQPMPENGKRANLAAIRRLKTDSGGFCKRVAFINPGNKVTLPTELDQQWSLNQSERIEETLVSEGKSLQPEKSYELQKEKNCAFSSEI